MASQVGAGVVGGEQPLFVGLSLAGLRVRYFALSGLFEQQAVVVGRPACPAANCFLRESAPPEVAVPLDELRQFRFRDVERGLGLRLASWCCRRLEGLRWQLHFVCWVRGPELVVDGAAAGDARDGDVVAVAVRDEVAVAVWAGALGHLPSGLAVAGWCWLCERHGLSPSVPAGGLCPSLLVRTCRFRDVGKRPGIVSSTHRFGKGTRGLVLPSQRPAVQQGQPLWPQGRAIASVLLDALNATGGRQDGLWRGNAG